MVAETIRNLPGAAWNHPTSSSSSLLLPSLHIEIKGMIDRAKRAGHTRLCGFKPDVCVLTCPRCSSEVPPVPKRQPAFRCGVFSSVVNLLTAQQKYL